MGRSTTPLLLALSLAIACGAAPLSAQASAPNDPSIQAEGEQAPTAEELAALRRAVEQDLDDVGKRLRFAQALIAVGRIGPAMDQLEEALSRDPDNAEGHAYLGLCYQIRRRTDDAVAAYRRALELDSDLLAAHNALAVLLAGEGENEEALSHLERAVELSPDALEPQLELASLLVRTGRFEDALARLEEAAEGSGDPRVGYSLALLLAACPNETVCDPERALALADALYRAQPTPGNAQLLALALGASGRFDEAVQVQGELIEIAEGAGLPAPVVERMRRTLESLERHERPDELFGVLVGGPAAESQD